MNQGTSMKENGKKIANVGMEQWSGHLITKNTKGTGEITCLMVMVNVIGMKTEPNIR